MSETKYDLSIQWNTIQERKKRNETLILATTDSYYDRDKPQKYYVKWKRPKQTITFGVIPYMWNV